MRKIVSWPYFVIASLIVLATAWFINGDIGKGFWITSAIVAIALVVNGIIAAFEDDQPGGFNAPDE